MLAHIPISPSYNTLPQTVSHSPDSIPHLRLLYLSIFPPTSDISDSLRTLESYLRKILVLKLKNWITILAFYLKFFFGKEKSLLKTLFSPELQFQFMNTFSKVRETGWWREKSRPFPMNTKLVALARNLNN